VKDLALAAAVGDVVEEDALAVDVAVEALLTVTSESLAVVLLDMVAVSVALQLLPMAEASVDLLPKLPTVVLLMAAAMVVAAMATPVAQVVSLPGGNFFQANGVRFSSTFVNSIEIWASLGMKVSSVLSSGLFNNSLLRHDNSFVCF
jgi:hypothetical protein